jgi:energy-coupling factor transport system ATP-binding protein
MGMSDSNAARGPLSLRDITFRYSNDRPPVIDDFSADFARAGVTALTGENGCGKTTLARIIVGILKPEAGMITLGGNDLSELSLTQTGRRIGYVMQEPSRQIFSLSIWEEVMYGLGNMVDAGELEREPAEERARKYLELFDLAGREEEFPFSLSKGEQQRLVLASVLAMEPEFLILDEPTSALDRGRKDALAERLRELACSTEKQRGIIVISHDRDFAAAVADSEIDMTGGGAHV